MSKSVDGRRYCLTALDSRWRAASCLTHKERSTIFSLRSSRRYLGRYGTGKAHPGACGARGPAHFCYSLATTTKAEATAVLPPNAVAFVGHLVMSLSLEWRPRRCVVGCDGDFGVGGDVRGWQGREGLINGVGQAARKGLYTSTILLVWRPYIRSCVFDGMDTCQLPVATVKT